MIKHIWFDFSETIAFLRKEKHDELRYTSYADITKKPLTEELKKEYEVLYERYNHSNAALFRSLGMPGSYWSKKINSIEPRELYTLAETSIPDVLKEIKQGIPISVFSNIELHGVLPALGIETSWFTNILSAGMVKEPKPALDGFYKMIELSDVPPQEIVYIGDHIGKDILPAKKVGIQTGFMWGHANEADYSFEHFDDILSLLN